MSLMMTSRTGFRFLFGAIFTVVLLLIACSENKGPPGRAETNSDKAFITVSRDALQSGFIKVGPVSRGLVPEVLQVTGRITVNENRTTRVGAMVEGRVMYVYANVGDRVHEDAKLAHLRSHEVDSARAEYARLNAELTQRKAEREFARATLGRITRLHDLKVASLEQVERAKTDLRMAKAGVTAVLADIGRLEERLDQLGVSAEGADEEYRRGKPRTNPEEQYRELVPVRAPLAGSILQRFISPGMVVNTTSDLFEISDLTSLWVKAQVPERYLSHLQVGKPVQIQVRAYGNESFHADISQIGDVLDPETRTIQVRCQLDNEQMRLKPEMYATISFSIGDAIKALVIPVTAVQELDGESTVFVFKEPNRFESRKVVLEVQAEGMAAVRDGLMEGEIIAVEGSFLLKSEKLKADMTTSE